MRGEDGRWHYMYTGPCEKRTKWPSERRAPDYKNSTDAFIFIYIDMIIKNVKRHTSVQILILYPVALPVRKELEFRSFKNWRIMKNFRKVKSIITVRKSLSQQPCVLVLWRCSVVEESDWCSFFAVQHSNFKLIVMLRSKYRCFQVNSCFRVNSRAFK